MRPVIKGRHPHQNKSLTVLITIISFSSRHHQRVPRLSPQLLFSTSVFVCFPQKRFERWPMWSIKAWPCTGERPAGARWRSWWDYRLWHSDAQWKCLFTALGVPLQRRGMDLDMAPPQPAPSSPPRSSVPPLSLWTLAPIFSPCRRRTRWQDSSTRFRPSASRPSTTCSRGRRWKCSFLSCSIR